MIRTKTFVFNAFQVNTYLLISTNNEAILIDGACYSTSEQEQLSNYLEKNKITLVRHILTHSHIDHILGAKYIQDTYGIKPEIHKAGLLFWQSASEYASVFGLTVAEPTLPDLFLDENSEIKLGDNIIKTIYCPGHADGSICFYIPDQDTLFSGDVLFAGSIGRTDLPTGDMNLLLKSIKEKLLILPDKTVVFPGHGAATTIDREKKTNPYL